MNTTENDFIREILENSDGSETRIGDFVIRRDYGIDCIYDGPGGDVVIPEEIGSLDFSDTFKNAKNITGLFLPKSAKKITIKAFGSRATLRKVEFSEGTEEIPETNFFANCKALEEVVLPESLQYIGAGVFKNTPWYSNTIEVVDGCYYLGRFLVDSKEDISVASVCEGTTMICGKAFQNRTGLTEINIPDSVRTIGAYAFFGCTSLTEVSLPNQISRIEKWSFGGCNSLKQIDIPVTDAEISEDAFGSEKFGGLFFPDYAFIPTDLKGTAGQMRFFVYCYLTSRERHTSDRQKKYDAEAKKRKAKLLEIALENKNLSVLRNLAPIAITNANIAELIETTQQRNAPDMTAFLLEWQEKHFGQADLEKQQRKEMNRNPLSAGELKKIWGTKKLSDGTLGITSYKGSDIDICIPDCIGKTKITVICSSAFSVFGPLGKTIPEAYTAARKQIRSVIIPDGITSIGFFAFDCCTKMESITIPVTVNAINMAFTHCPNLTIHAPAGSYAEQYAKEHNIPFVAE